MMTLISNIKNKLVCIGAIVGMVGMALVAYGVELQKGERIHQHLAKEPKSECEHGQELFSTHLPLVSIQTEGQSFVENKETNLQQTMNIEVYDQQERYNHLTDVPQISSKAKIHYRGNSSKHFDKKPYAIHLVNKQGEENKLTMMGMPAHDEWILNGPFLDKSLIRSYLGMNISAEIMGYAPRVRFCEVFIDGKYQGVYLMMEKITLGEERVNVTPYKKGDLSSSYIVRLDRGGEEGSNLNNFGHYSLLTQSTLNVIYPAKKDRSEELITMIEQDISRFEKALYSYDYKDKQYGYKQYIYPLSFIDYFIINEFFQNLDAGCYSTYLYKDIRGKLSIGPVWDFNNAFDNYMETATDGTGFEMVDKLWYTMLMKDEEFVERVIARYRQLRKSYLSEEYLLNYIDETVAYLGEAVIRNFEVWDYTFLEENSLLTPSSRNIAGYEEAITQLKTFIIKRGQWMDEHIELLYQYSHPSKNKKFNH